MSEFIIEFDDSKGCKNCPYCIYKEGFEILGDTGFYCTKMNPHKFISYASTSSKNVSIPYWCNLRKYVPPTTPIVPPTQTIKIVNKPTEKLTVQGTISNEMIIASRGLLNAEQYIKENIVRQFINHPLFRQNIKWTEIPSSMSINRCSTIRGEIEIVKDE